MMHRTIIIILLASSFSTANQVVARGRRQLSDGYYNFDDTSNHGSDGGHNKDHFGENDKRDAYGGGDDNSGGNGGYERGGDSYGGNNGGGGGGDSYGGDSEGSSGGGDSYERGDSGGGGDSYSGGSGTDGYGGGGGDNYGGGGDSSYGGGGDSSYGGGGSSTDSYGGDSSGGGGDSYGEGSDSYGSSSSSSSYGGGGDSSYGGGSDSYGGDSYSSGGGSYSGYGGGGSSSYRSSSKMSHFMNKINVKVPILPILLIFGILLYIAMVSTAFMHQRYPESMFTNCCRLSVNSTRGAYQIAFNLYHCRLGDIPPIVCAMDDEDDLDDEEIARMKPRPGISKALEIEHRRSVERTVTEAVGGDDGKKLLPGFAKPFG